MKDVPTLIYDLALRSLDQQERELGELDLSKRTASARNSFEYGGVFGIDRHPLQQAR